MFRQRAALNDSGTLNLDIIKYFAENRGAGRTVMEMALEFARQKNNLEMIEYFENKLIL